MASCSLASCSLFRLGSWVLRCPGSPMSLRFCVLPGVHVFLIHGFHLPPGFSFGFCLSRLRCSALRFLPYTFPLVFHPDVSASAFPSYCLLSSSALLFFLCAGGIGRVVLPGFFHALHLLSLVYLPLSFLLVRHFPSFFRRSSDSVASPFHSAAGSPFGPSPFLFSLFALLVR